MSCTLYSTTGFYLNLSVVVSITFALWKSFVWLVCLCILFITNLIKSLSRTHTHYNFCLLICVLPCRELLVSIRFNEPGWQWSGSFLPDHLGDTQLKMRNYVSGRLSMIRVEVQNADVSIRDEKIVGSLNGNSGTNLILLSDDDTGYMPYRIDNFSKEVRDCFYLIL